MYRPSASFSKASCCALGPRRRVGQRDRAAARSPSSRQPPKSCDLAVLAVALVPAAVLDRRVDGGEEPRRAARRQPAAGRPSESNAPALTRLSNTRLLTSRRSRCSQSAWSESMRPSSLRDAEQRLDRAFADVLDRGQAEAHAVRLDRERAAGSR